jgi:hypothetical protein
MKGKVKMLDRLFRASSVPLALAVLSAAGCGHVLPSAADTGFAAPQAALVSSRPTKPAKIKVTPGKLSFTTTKNLTLTIDEAGYTGKFTIANSKPKVAKAESSAKGPRAAVKVTALAAGSGTLTIRDSHKQSVKVPFGVTTGVVVIQ